MSTVSHGLYSNISPLNYFLQQCMTLSIEICVRQYRDKQNKTEEEMESIKILLFHTFQPALLLKNFQPAFLIMLTQVCLFNLNIFLKIL